MRIEARRHDELRAGVARQRRLLRVEHGPRSDEQRRNLSRDAPQRLARGRGAEGDLGTGETAGDKRLRQRYGVVGIVDHDHRYNPRFAQAWRDGSRIVGQRRHTLLS